MMSFLSHIVASYCSNRLDNMALFVPRLYKAIQQANPDTVSGAIRVELLRYLCDVASFLRDSSSVPDELLIRFPVELENGDQHSQGKQSLEPDVSTSTVDSHGPIEPPLDATVVREDQDVPITAVALAQLSNIRHSIGLTRDTAKGYPVLVVTFEGKYGHGSDGNADADYIRGITHGAVAAWSPAAVIFDFRRLVYSWGNRIWAVFTDPIGVSQIDDLPKALVVSDKCAAAFQSGGNVVPSSFRKFSQALEYVSIELHRSAPDQK